MSKDAIDKKDQNVTDAQKKKPGIAIASLVLGIAGIVVFCIGPVFAIPAIICGHIGRSRIKAANGTLQGTGLALAGTILGYAGIALFIAFIPVFLKSRDAAQRSCCMDNLMLIDHAKEEIAAARSLTNGAIITEQDIAPYCKNGKLPVCPKGGHYTLNPIGKSPACSIHGKLRWGYDDGQSPEMPPTDKNAP